MRVNRRWVSALAMAIGLGFAMPAHAVTDAQRAGARAQASAGVEAFDKGQFKEALDLFMRAESVVHSPVHLLYIARSHIKLGKLVQAQEALHKIQNEEVPAGAPAYVVAANKDAQALLDEIGPKIPVLTLQIKGATTASVTIDGEPVPPALVGVPTPTNPGEHVVNGTGDGLSGEAKVTLAEGEKRTLELELTKPSATPAATTTPATEASATLDTEAPGPSNGLRTAAYIVGGAGVVGLALGIGFAVKSTGIRGDADDQNEACRVRPAGCTNAEIADIEALDKDANSAGVLATVGLVAGGVGLAAGATLFVLSMKKPSDETTASGPRIRGFLGPNRIGLAGTF